MILAASSAVASAQTHVPGNSGARWVDTGLTLLHVHNILGGRGAKSIRVATLLEKPGNCKYKYALDYVGFKIPDKFVVGFGLDHAQRYRNLPDIRVLNEV